MKEYITRKMVEQGLEQRIIKPSLDDFGLACYIGDNWFFFGGSEFELTDPKRMGFGLLLNEIKIVLDEWYEEICEGDDYYKDEYLYYYYYLVENLKWD